MKYQIKGLTEISETGLEFLKQWTDEQLEKVENTIYLCFRGQRVYQANKGQSKTILTRHALSEVFGLPYTSSGSCAGLWNTNSQVYVDAQNVWNIEGFLLTTDERVIIYTNDNEENEKYFQINL